MADVQEWDMFFGKIITKRLIELNISEEEKKLSIVPLLDLDSKVKYPQYNSHSYWSSETLPEKEDVWKLFFTAFILSVVISDKDKQTDDLSALLLVKCSF